MKNGNSIMMVFAVLAVILIVIAILGGCATTGKQAKEDNQEPYFYVESVKPGSVANSFDVCLIELDKSAAMKKAKIHEKISDELLMLSDNYRKLDKTSQSAMKSWQESFNKKVPYFKKMFKKLDKIQGKSEIVTIPFTDAPFISPGIVLKRELIKEEVIDDSGIVKVTRHNFYRWKIAN